MKKSEFLFNFFMHYLFFKVQKENICLVKNILESYENLMIVSTVDEELSKIQVTIAPDFLEDCLKIVKDMENQFQMIPINEPSNISQGHY